MESIMFWLPQSLVDVVSERLKLGVLDHAQFAQGLQQLKRSQAGRNTARDVVVDAIPPKFFNTLSDGGTLILYPQHLKLNSCGGSCQTGVVVVGTVLPLVVDAYELCRRFDWLFVTIEAALKTALRIVDILFW